MTSIVFASEKKDCIDCNYKEVVGAPGVGNLDKLTKIVKTGTYQDEDFGWFLKTFCSKFEQASSAYAFKKDIIEEMKKTPYSFDKYWMQPGCYPTKIGNTDSPIVHLAAEETAGRKQFLEALYKYYKDRNELKTWVKVINSKNTKGFTLLDYIVYLNKNKSYREEEVPDVNELVKFICDKGGTFSVNTDRKCPMSI